MGMDMGIVATKYYSNLITINPMDRQSYDEIKDNDHFYDEYGGFIWPNVCDVWYARKFWDMINNVPYLREHYNDTEYIRIHKDVLEQMIRFYSFNPDYWGGFLGLPRLCELYQMYDSLTAQNIKLYFYCSY